MKIVIYKPLLRQTTASKRPDGYGGYANSTMHLQDSAGAGIVNSDMQNDCHYWTFPLRVLTAIVLEIPLADLASLTHCSSYCNYNPPGGLPSPLQFPDWHAGRSRRPSLSLPQMMELRLHCVSAMLPVSRLPAATEIAKKRKDFSE